jgi:radical SAM protein with 4Fe4S-binding SPASM domain
MNWQPNTLWWIITGKCNLHCSHCYIKSPLKQYGQISKQQAFYVVEKAIDLGIEKFFITGGEPFLRSDILYIFDYIYCKGGTITGLDTNATLLTDKIIDFLAEHNIFINISHDGVDFANKNREYDFEEKIIPLLKSLKQKGVTVNVNTVLTPNSIENIISLFDILLDSNIDNWLLFSPFEYGSYTINFKPLSVDEEIELYKTIHIKWIQSGKPFGIRLGDVFDSTKNDELWDTYVCEYFRNTIALFPDGEIAPCCKYITHKDYSLFPNIFNNTISEILQSDMLLKYKNLLMNDFYKENPHCYECHYNAKCNGGCRMEVYLESQKLLSKCNRTCLLMNKIQENEYK